MSNYPPTPSFGLPFSLAPQERTPISTSHGINGFRRDNPPAISKKQQPVTSDGFEKRSMKENTSPITPSATDSATLNTFNAFQHNGALPALNSQAFGRGAPPPPPAFEHFAKGTLPPPPYPPIPIPQTRFPAYPLPNISRGEVQSFIPPPPPPFTLGRPPSLPLVSNTPNILRSHQHLSSGPDREEGELSDVEVGQVPSIQAEIPRRTRSMSNKPLRMSNGARTKGPRHEVINDKKTEVQPRSSFARERPQSSTQNWSPRPYPGSEQRMAQRSPVTTSRLEVHDSSRRFSPDNDVRHASVREIGTIPSSDRVESRPRQSTSPDHESPATFSASMADIRASSINALLKLYAHRVMFEDLVAEGIDEQVLRNLYEEVGIKVSPPSPTSDSIGEMGQHPSTGKTSVRNSRSNGPDSSTVQRQLPRRSPSRLRQETKFLPAKSQELLTKNSVVIANTNGDKPAVHDTIPKVAPSLPITSLPKRTNSPQASTSLANTTSSQESNSKPASPPLERKDKIARLLAAKNVKTLPTSLGQKKPAVSVAHRNEPTLQQSPVQEGLVLGAATNGSNLKPCSEVSSESPIDPTTKSMVQTESSRQQVRASENGIKDDAKPKTQMLPPTANLKRFEPHPNSEASSEAIDKASLDNEDINHWKSSYPQPATSAVHSQSHIPQQGLQASNIPFTGIPGLFMTSPAITSDIMRSNPATPVEQVSLSEEIVNPRKRPVASDFDPGPISAGGTWKRPFGCSRTDNLIIEVSDDETVDEADASDIEFEYGTTQQIPQVQGAQQAQKEVALRDLPPPTDLPSRKTFSLSTASAPTSTMNTPPILQKPALSKESDSLKLKEATIEEMRRKIAMMEQRARAKGSASRAETPVTPGGVPVAKGIASSPAVPAKSSEPSVMAEPSTSERVASTINANDERTSEQREVGSPKEAAKVAASAAASENKAKTEELAKFRAAALEKLKAAQLEKARHLALETAKAQDLEKERTYAHERQKIDEQKKLKLAEVEDKRLAELERARVEVLEKQRAEESERATAAAEEVEKARAIALEKEKKAQELERARAAVVQRRKAAELEKVRIAALEMQRAADEENEKRQVEESNKAQSAMKARRQVEEENRARVKVAEQKRQRRAAIESGLPLLDAQVAKNKDRLEQLRREILEAEADIQKGLEERKVLVKEMEGLGVVTEGIATEVLQAQKAEILEQRRIDIDHTPALREAVLQEKESQIATKIDQGPHSITIPDHSEQQRKRENGADVSRIDGSVHFIDGRVGDYVQTVEHNVARNGDTTESGTEEGEITNDELQDVTNGVQNEQDNNRSQRDLLPITAAKENTKSSSQSSDELMDDDTAPDPTRLTHDGMLDQPQRRTVSESVEGDSFTPEQTSEQEEGEIDSCSVSMDDSDEYEPPEIASPPLRVEVSTELPVLDPALSRASPSPAKIPQVLSDVSLQTNSHATELNQGAASRTQASAVPDPVITDLQLTQPNRFVPYESPLKQFRAFRYHPDFATEVPGGFRSLTYSHKINVSNPVCLYEAAGGICNDNSCENQHFRDMGLSDDKILVQMGSVQEGGTPAEVEQYIAGLKGIIQEMRGRKVNDFNTVASEIAAYRARFLGDKSRVLPL